ncbi:hypothetical protein [Polynucleobacter sinensis]|uniref:hypothetical protein n=1 Tax=Polynucleobacter sinensis TaxID=1743157 RepID=UPI000785B778|nr:hypothetical protein [Polynucleobacter sinensis]
METKLAAIRKIGGVTCSTPDDIVLGLESLKDEGDDLFIQSLNNAILEDDMDIICGHIDWFRRKLGKSCMDFDGRTLVASFYSQYFKQHTKDGEISSADFISDALEHFS